MQFMANRPLRRRLLAVLAAPLLLASLSAAAPARTSESAVTADIVSYKDTFYSDASYSVLVGKAFGYCDGDYGMVSGYQTPYVRTTPMFQCP